MHTDSPIDPGSYRLLELFRGELAEVRFPDVDREVLESLAGEVAAQHERAAALRAELARIEEQLQAARRALLERASEGLAYARLYAARHPELAAELDSIRLGVAKPGRKSRKPRKPRATRVAPDAGAASTPRRSPEEPALLEAVG